MQEVTRPTPHGQLKHWSKQKRSRCGSGKREKKLYAIIWQFVFPCGRPMRKPQQTEDSGYQYFGADVACTGEGDDEALPSAPSTFCCVAQCRF